MKFIKNKTYGFLQKLYQKIYVIGFDCLAIPLAWYLAYWLRFNMQLMPSWLFNKQAGMGMLILIMVQTSCYYYCKIYRGLWRFVSINDLQRIIQASIYAIFICLPIFYLTSILEFIPRSIFPLYAILYIALLCSGRLLRRIHNEYWKISKKSSERKKVLIIGAGRAAESLVRELLRQQLYLPVGLVDDNKNRVGLEVHGIPVLGTSEQIGSLVEQYQAKLIFIAIPSANAAQMRRIVSYCEQSKVIFRTLPSIMGVASGQVTMQALRPVNIEDLLGRAQVELEWNKISADIFDKVVMITGGGGSIGSELCRQIVKLKPGKLFIVDHSEFNLYSIGEELKKCFDLVELHLVSVTDAVAINGLLKRAKPHIILHAAAYKHVPLLEDQIRVAVLNNIIGTQILVEASLKVGVEKFVLISTDKAVNPTNIMGATKRVAEIYCQNLNEQVKTKFITVRFGNVLGSAGSVIPLFQKQLAQGDALTVTHPDIQRFFMTIPEACQLILQAMVNGDGGEIFVLDMGEPIKISYLAEQMIRLAGKIPGKDIKIEYIGLRPGEKLFEELFHSSEELLPTAHEKLFKARFRRLIFAELIETLKLLKNAAYEQNNSELLILLKSLVPEFKVQIKTQFSSIT